MHSVSGLQPLLAIDTPLTTAMISYGCFLQNVEEWSINNVVEWMATVNLYRYSDLFKRHSITGAELTTITDERLRVDRKSVV